MAVKIRVTDARGTQAEIEVTGKEILAEWHEKQAKLKPYFDNLERMRDECTHLYPTYSSNAGVELCCGCCRPPQVRGQLEFEFPKE